MRSIDAKLGDLGFIKRRDGFYMALISIVCVEMVFTSYYAVAFGK